MIPKPSVERSRAKAKLPIDIHELPAYLTVRETARVLRIGLNECYRALRDGNIPSLRVGRTYRIPRAALLVLNLPEDRLARPRNDTVGVQRGKEAGS
jgi:excisionase family DNA binding protein